MDGASSQPSRKAVVQKLAACGEQRPEGWRLRKASADPESCGPRRLQPRKVKGQNESPKGLKTSNKGPSTLKRWRNPAGSGNPQVGGEGPQRNDAGSGTGRTVGGVGGSAPQNYDGGVGAKTRPRRAPQWKPRSAARSGVRQHYGVNRNIVGRATGVTTASRKVLLSGPGAAP